MAEYIIIALMVAAFLANCMVGAALSQSNDPGTHVFGMRIVAFNSGLLVVCNVILILT